MTHFILGIITAAVLALSVTGLNKLLTPVIGYLRKSLNESDVEELNKLVKYRIHWIISLAFVLVIWAVGLLCGVMLR